MAKKSGGGIHQDVYNEVDGKDSDSPDVSGAQLYYSYDEVMSMHLSETGDMVETPNARASRDIFGGPTKGEPNPIGMKGK